MARSGVFYAIKVMERTAERAAAPGAPGAPARPGIDREAPATARPDGGISARVRHLLAIARPGGTASRAGRGRKSLRGAARG